MAAASRGSVPRSYYHSVIPAKAGIPLLFGIPKVSGTPAFAGVTGVDGVRSVLVGPVPLWLRLLASAISHLADAEWGGYLVPIVP